MKERIIVWFSCGAASAVAAKETLRIYGGSHEVVIICCDTRPSEHEDNYRFSEDIKNWLGHPITFLRNDKYETVDDVFERERFMSGPKGARCTVELKKKVRFAFAKPDDIHVFGLTSDEGKRIREFEERNPDLRLKWVLKDLGLTKQNCLTILALEKIKIPVMYQLGFDNNNCPGCVKATSPWYWDMVRKHFPEVFRRRCVQSRELGVRLVERYKELGGGRIFLDELPPGPFKKKKKERLSCGPECGIQLSL